MTRLAAFAALALLCGCGLRPVYGGGAGGKAVTALSSIAVDPIPDRAGVLVRDELGLRLGSRPDSPKYRLKIELDDKIEGYGIRGDASITRERRTLRARWQLVSADGATTYIDATAGSDEGIDVVRSSNYAVVAAEDSALERLAAKLADQIAARIALYARTEQ